MQLELNMKEKQYLGIMLTKHLQELSHEINHTDNRDFRENLKEEAEVLRMVQSKLAQ